MIGGARDGIFGGHVIGPIAGALLPCRFRSRWHRAATTIAPAPIPEVTAAVPTNAGDDNPLPFAMTLASAAAVPIRMVSMVSCEASPTLDRLRRGCGRRQITAAE